MDFRFAGMGSFRSQDSSVALGGYWIIRKSKEKMGFHMKAFQISIRILV